MPAGAEGCWSTVSLSVEGRSSTEDCIAHSLLVPGPAPWSLGLCDEFILKFCVFLCWGKLVCHILETGKNNSSQLNLNISVHHSHGPVMGDNPFLSEIGQDSEDATFSANLSNVESISWN